MNWRQSDTRESALLLRFHIDVQMPEDCRNIGIFPLSNCIDSAEGVYEVVLIRACAFL